MKKSPEPHHNTLFCDECTKCAALFSGLSGEDQQWTMTWLRKIKTISYEKGEKIVRENMPAFGLYLICSGRVKVVLSGSANKEQIIKIVGPGEMLGEESLMGDSVYAYFAETLEPVTSKFINQENLQELMARFPDLMQRLAQKLALEVKALQKKLLELSFNSCKDKVARLLIALTEAYENANDEAQLQLDLTRADLAKMAGISVETAIRTLSHFEKRGWISVHYHTITLLDRDSLAAFSSPLNVDLLEHVM